MGQNFGTLPTNTIFNFKRESTSKLYAPRHELNSEGAMRPGFVLAALGTLVVAHYHWHPADNVLLARGVPFDPAALAQQLVQISGRQQQVLRQLGKLEREAAGSPAAKAAQLAAQEVPYRLAGWTAPGVQPAAHVPYSGGSASAGAARLHGYSTGQNVGGGVSPWSGEPASSGAARLHGYSTGQMSNASPWSGGNGAAPAGPARLGGGWQTPTARAAHSVRSTAARDFSTKQGRDARRRVSLRLQGLQAAKQAAVKELRRVVGQRPVEKLNIVITKAKPQQVPALRRRLLPRPCHRRCFSHAATPQTSHR
jgi:hypothetical protein